MAERVRKVAIVTDASADLPGSIELRRKLGVESVVEIPIGLTIGEDSYVVGTSVNTEYPPIDNDTFRQRIEREMEKKSGIMPKTSASLEIDFEHKYGELIEQGLDVVSIHVSEAFSRTIPNARSAREIVDDNRISIFDSQTTSMALGLMVREAEEMAISGASREEILERLTDIRERTTLRAATTNLPFLVAGGRVPEVKAMLGRILKLVPVIKIDHIAKLSDVKPVGMFKSGIKKQGVEWMEDYVKSKNPERMAIVDFAAKDVSDELAMRLIRNNVLPEDKIYRGDLGPITGSNGGPGTWAAIVVRGR